MARAVVYQNHTLGVYHPETNSIDVLHSSVLKGAPINDYLPEPKLGDWGEMRYATKEDFEDFRVRFHPSYLED